MGNGIILHFLSYKIKMMFTLLHLRKQCNLQQSFELAHVVVVHLSSPYWRKICGWYFRNWKIKTSFNGKQTRDYCLSQWIWCHYAFIGVWDFRKYVYTIYVDVFSKILTMSSTNKRLNTEVTPLSFVIVTTKLVLRNTFKNLWWIHQIGFVPNHG